MFGILFLAFERINVQFRLKRKEADVANVSLSIYKINFLLRRKLIAQLGKEQ